MKRESQGPLRTTLARQLNTTADTLMPVLGPMIAPPESALPVPPASRRDVWERVEADNLITRALAERDTPWPQPLAHDAARIHGDGDRSTWEQTAFARVQRSSRSVVAAVVTGESCWLPSVLDGASLLCEQSSWCWPAHDDAFSRRGWVLPDVTSPVVDLGASEVAAHLAWLDHVIGAELETAYAGVRARIRTEVRSRVLEPFADRDDWWWLGAERPTINWTPWILGNVLVAALRLLDAPDDAELRIRIIDRVLLGLDRYIADLPADGAVDEGYHYWWAGAARLFEALEALAHATLERIDFIDGIPVLRELVAFPHRMQLGDDWVVSVADSRARAATPQPWNALTRAARRLKDGDAEAFARGHESHLDADETMNLGRLLSALSDDHDGGSGRFPFPAEVWLPSVQMLIARESAGTPAGLTVVAKGGHNDESHNHNDVGSVIVASDGVPTVVDAGRPTYTAQTFSADRYGLWMMRSTWHSIPVIAGHAQKAGADYRASAVSVADGEFSLDIAATYGLPDRTSWHRTVRLDRDAREVRVHDEWHELPAPVGDGATESRFLLAGSVTLGEGRAVVEPLEGATPLEILWNPAAPARLTTKRLDDPMLSSVWGDSLTRLEIDVSRVSDVTVTMRQYGTGGAR
ncbi:heparinase II/III-family protein [Microbacterium sp. MPKO10]|uniref:heparinase II/III-family protein n=1 Tax=Microbacterium sp. MPKO10 TaxID=2989818 RepID=UPI002236A693|nr:heparinase II/III-family protein [Microbacterium sp. MPKO10]MCW4457133.1 heparinase II/III-family protein [Microbacterium sp. MPKO10]